MKAKGRFGLIIPEINSALDRDFVEGAFIQAKTLGYDLVIYTGIFNSLREYRYDSYISGLENIYTLAHMTLTALFLRKNAFTPVMLSTRSTDI